MVASGNSCFISGTSSELEKNSEHKLCGISNYFTVESPKKGHIGDNSIINSAAAILYVLCREVVLFKRFSMLQYRDGNLMVTRAVSFVANREVN